MQYKHYCKTVLQTNNFGLFCHAFLLLQLKPSDICTVECALIAYIKCARQCTSCETLTKKSNY